MEPDGTHDNEYDQPRFKNTQGWSAEMANFIKTCVTSVTATNLTPNLLLQVHKYLVMVM